jgi:hypothetical protein
MVSRVRASSLACARDCGQGAGAARKNHLLNAEPTVGSAPPWAGVTPAPGDKERCGTASLLEGLGGRGGGNLPRPLFYGRGGRRAQPPVGEGSGLKLYASNVGVCLLNYLREPRAATARPPALALSTGRARRADSARPRSACTGGPQPTHSLGCTTGTRGSPSARSASAGFR